MTSYSATIMAHFRNPQNYGDLPDADIVREVYSPICGDRIRLALRLRDSVVAEARFKGDVCAICKAAASVLTELVVGQTLARAGELAEAELLDALDASIDAGRLQCALLPLRALRATAPTGRGEAEAPFVSAVILAAGASRRFGGNKLLAPLAGVPLVRRTAENTLAARVRDVVVVVGRNADEVRRALHGLPLRFAVNAGNADGMSGSLRVGVTALSHRATAAFIVLGDQPFVAAEVLNQLITAYRRTDRSIVAPVYAGTRGNPVLFDVSMFSTLLRVEGDQGASAILHQAPDAVATVPFPVRPPLDVDTPDDYDSAVRHIGRAPGPRASSCEHPS